MSRLHFKPMPWLSVFSLISLVILISLAFWQYKRLHWKTQLLAQVEQAVNAPPITSLTELKDEIKAGVAVDFRRIEIDVSKTHISQNKLVYEPQRGGVFWRGYTPITEPQSGAILYAAMDIVEDANRDIYKARPVERLVGYVRLSRPLARMEGIFKAKADPETNRYFKFNQTGDWEIGLSGQGYFFDQYYLDTSLSAPRAAMLPVKRPKIRNNHFDYMLTWASFALILCIIYVIMHMRAGRLSWKNPR